MIDRRLALATALAAGALVLAGCSSMSMPSMSKPTMSTPPVPSTPAGPTVPSTPSVPTAPATPGMPSAPGMPSTPGMPAAPAAAQPIIGNSMGAALNGASQVPPNGSSGTGSAAIKLDGDILSWTIVYSGLSGPVTGAHFHGPAPAGVNAGVVVPFAGSLASPITGSKQLTAAQIAELKSGLWYLNLHTAANPGGEIRGQVK
jgi:hypothetical protein